MFEINTSCEINAEPAAVWAVLTDFDAFAQWNPFMTSARRDKNRLYITINPPHEKTRHFSPLLLKMEESEELRWVGKTGSDCLLRGEHAFVLEKIAPGKTRLLHTEVFSGALTCLITASQREHIRAGFESMNVALANRVAQIAQPALRR